MTIPQKMKQKWERQPQRIGMILGFFALPLFWMLQESLLRLVFPFRSAPGLDFITCFVTGAIPGVILGSGLSKAALAWRKNDWGDVKWHLLSHSAVVLLLCVLLLALTVKRSLRVSIGQVEIFGISVPRWLSAVFSELLSSSYFPLHCALLMFFIGLLMCSRR